MSDAGMGRKCSLLRAFVRNARSRSPQRCPQVWTGGEKLSFPSRNLTRTARGRYNRSLLSYFVIPGVAPKARSRGTASRSDREADVPAPQSAAQASTRLLVPHGDQERPARHCRPPEKRPQAAFRLGSFQSLRAREFARLRRRGRRAQGAHLTIVAAPSPPGARPRLAIATTKGFEDAVARNRARRRLRAAFAGLAEAPRGLDLIVTARISARTAEFKELCDDLRTTLGRL